MTQPTDRPGIDELRELLRDAEGDRDSWAREAKSAEAQVERLQAERHTYQRAWHSAKDRARKQHTRAELAEATLTAVRKLATDTRRYTGPGADSYQLGKYDLADAVLAVLDQHGQTTV